MKFIFSFTQPWRPRWKSADGSHPPGGVGLIGIGWQQCFHHFGFTGRFFPEDEAKYYT